MGYRFVDLFLAIDCNMSGHSVPVFARRSCFTNSTYLPTYILGCLKHFNISSFIIYGFTQNPTNASNKSPEYHETVNLIFRR